MLAGDIETPVGTPPACTLICDENPLAPVADNVTEAELPPYKDWLVGLTAMLKLGGGGGECVRCCTEATTCESVLELLLELELELELVTESEEGI